MQELTAKPRTELGKKAKALRRAGFLPGVVYGEGTESKPIAVSMRDFEKVYTEAGESSIITMNLDEGKQLNVMIQDVAYDPLKSKPIHADFRSVRMDREINAKIPFAFNGESPAVKNEGGIMVRVMHEVEVRALPKDLPHELAVDLTRLEKIGDRIFIKDVSLPVGVETRAEADDVVVLIEAPRSEEELKELETEAAPEAAEVKTEQEVEAEEKAAKESEEKGGESKPEEKSRS